MYEPDAQQRRRRYRRHRRGRPRDRRGVCRVPVGTSASSRAIPGGWNARRKQSERPAASLHRLGRRGGRRRGRGRSRPHRAGARADRRLGEQRHGDGLRPGRRADAGGDAARHRRSPIWGRCTARWRRCGACAHRNRGTIVNVGSALAYRAIPLQSAYCAAKFAVRGFTDALRSELLHDGLRVHVTMVQLPALNTPQFDWALNKMKRRPQPVPPIFQPEVAARAILFAATHRRREVWVEWPTFKAILANAVAPLGSRSLPRQAGLRRPTDAEPVAPDRAGQSVPCSAWRLGRAWALSGTAPGAAGKSRCRPPSFR